MAVNYGLIGSVTHGCLLVACVFYAVAVTGHFKEWWELSAFGENWARDGFCVSHPGTWHNAHLLCLYTDTAWALVLFVLGTKCGDRTELAAVKASVVSVLAHGLAHGYISNVGGTMPVGNGETTYTELVVKDVVLFIFWFSFTSMTPAPKWTCVLQSLAHTWAYHFVPPLLVFAYANTAIFFNLSGASLLYEPRDKFYALSALCAGLPPMIATFLEPLFCDSLLINWGGHLIFDFSIPLGQTLYFLLAYNLSPRPTNKNKLA